MSSSCLLCFVFFFFLFLQDKTQTKSKQNLKVFNNVFPPFGDSWNNCKVRTQPSQSVCLKRFVVHFVTRSCRDWQKYNRETMCCLEEGIRPFYYWAAIGEWHHAVLPRAIFSHSNQKGLTWWFPTWGLGSPRVSHYKSDESQVDYRRQGNISFTLSPLQASRWRYLWI